MGYYALRSLFTNIYHKEWAKEYLPTPKVAKVLPLVLSKGEVADVLGAIDNFKHRTIIMLIYSTGARVSESANLKLTDIDSKRIQVNIQEGKGLKQRKVPLSPILLAVLREYYRGYKPQHYLFEGAGGKGTHLGITAVRTSGKTTAPGCTGKWGCPLMSLSGVSCCMYCQKAFSRCVTTAFSRTGTGSRR